MEHDNSLTTRPTEVPPAKIIGQTKEINGQTYVFAPASVDQLDRYFGKVRTHTVSASMTLALDMADPSQRPVLSAIFDERPGIALKVVSVELAAKGFGEGQD